MKVARALGNNILADPKSDKIKDKLNIIVKKSLIDLAPAVLVNIKINILI